MLIGWLPVGSAVLEIPTGFALGMTNLIHCCVKSISIKKNSVGNGLRAVPQYRMSDLLTGTANTENVDFDPFRDKIHGNGT